MCLKIATHNETKAQLTTLHIGLQFMLFSADTHSRAPSLGTAGAEQFAGSNLSNSAKKYRHIATVYKLCLYCNIGVLQYCTSSTLWHSFYKYSIL